MRIITTGFPGPGKGCLFVEVEDDDGRSIDAGEWRKREDGLAELVLEVPTPSELATLRRLRAGELRLVAADPDDDCIVQCEACQNAGHMDEMTMSDDAGWFCPSCIATWNAPPAAKEEGNG